MPGHPPRAAATTLSLRRGLWLPSPQHFPGVSRALLSVPLSPLVARYEASYRAASAVVCRYLGG